MTPSEAQGRREERNKAADKVDLYAIKVTSFKLKLKDGQAVVGDASKKGNDEALKKKSGKEAFERIKAVFEEAQGGLKGEEKELNKPAFHFYEAFRPSVPHRQKGWGRKGKQDLETVKSVISVSNR